MPKRQTPQQIAAQIRATLKNGGSAEHAKGVQWFFKEEIKSHGWYTARLRKAAVATRREIRKEAGLDFLLQVADQLFRGRVLEEKIFAVFLLEKLTSEFGDAEFGLFESWLARISSWADHDGLVHYLIAPMMAEEAARATAVFRWAKSRRSLASSRGLCSADPGHAAEDVLPADYAALKSSAQR